MLSRIIVQFLVETSNIEELDDFNKKVCIPQKAKYLSEHILAAKETLKKNKKEHETNAKILIDQN